MKLHNLQPAEGSVHKQKRLGRGEASGKGGTSTKGNKGGQSRTGYSVKWLMKVDRCLFREDCLSVGLRIITVSSIKFSI